jgi:hypothetical protein
MKKRYKVSKEQLERVVESFVMESAAPEAKKHVKGSLGDKMMDKDNAGSVSEKDWGVNDEKKHASEAKKHVQSMGGASQSSDKGEGMKDAPVTTAEKKKHAPEAKKHVKGSVSEARKKEIARIMAENNITEEELEEGKWFNREMGGKESFMADLKTKARSFKALTGKSLSNDEAKALFNQAQEDSFGGSLRVTAKGSEGELVYDDSSTKAGKGASVTSIAR